MNLRYGSICSGIEAASVAWSPLGWTPAWFAEIDPFASAVLAHRYPEVLNFGDFTRIDRVEPVDVLVGGPPCQSFSVAGGRGGLADPRGNLAIEFVRLADRLRPRWLVFENVPGLLSIDGGRAFGTLLGAMGECGYGTAYRVLDAQHFGVPQRRRRVFVVGHSEGGWQRAAAVLFERGSLSGDSAPGGPTRESTADAVAAGAGGSGDVAHTLTARNYRLDPTEETLVFHETAITSAVNRSTVIELVPTLACDARMTVCQPARRTVRRLTPVECERLQGLPDNWTNVPHRGRPAADGPRYQAIGNSMAVPVVRWIGQQIEAVEATA